jgi:hypothetical protein
MADATPGQVKFVCLRDDKVLRLHMYTEGGTLMSSLEAEEPGELKAITTAWLGSRGMSYDEGELDAAIGRTRSEEP